MASKPTIFSVDYLEIFNRAVSEFQSETGYALERSDAEQLMIQLFSTMVYKWGSDWIEKSLQNYLEWMSGDQLDAYGAANDVPRLTSTPSGSWVRFIFKEPLETYYPIYKNTIVEGTNDNGTFTFKVLEEILASPTDTYIDIWVEEFLSTGGNSGDLANDIIIGDINTLNDEESRYTQVDSVSNIGESYGGHPSEEDDRYKNRLKYILGKPSTAGAFDAYKYHALSAHVKVLDIGITKPSWAIDIYTLPYDFENKIIGDLSTQLSNLAFSTINVNDTDNGLLYWSISGSPTRTLTLYKDAAKTVAVGEYVGANGVGVTIAAKPGYTLTGTVDITGSTNDTDIANTIETYSVPMCAIDQMMNPATGYSKIKPMNDIVNNYMIESKSFTISKLNISIFEGNVETVKKKAEQIVTTYLSILKSKAGKDAIRGDLDKMIRDMGGIYDIDSEFNSSSIVKTVAAQDKEYLYAAMPTINVTVHTD